MKVHNDFLNLMTEMEEISNAKFELAGDHFLITEQKFMKARKVSSLASRRQSGISDPDHIASHLVNNLFLRQKKSVCSAKE